MQDLAVYRSLYEMLHTMLECVEDGSVKEHEDWDPETGICDNIWNLWPEAELNKNAYMGVLHLYFKQWPHYSGNPNYPVPNPVVAETCPAATAYHKSMAAKAWFQGASAPEMWDRMYEYGKLRRDLLKFVVSQLEKDLNGYYQ